MVYIFIWYIYASLIRVTTGRPNKNPQRQQAAAIRRGKRRMGIRSVFDGGEMRREFEKSGIDTKFIPIIWKHLLLNLNNLFQNADCSNYRWEWDKHVPSLPSSAYSLLRSNFRSPLSSSLHSVFHSADNPTSKLLIKLYVLSTTYNSIYMLLCAKFAFFFQFSFWVFICVTGINLYCQNGAFVEAVIMRYDTRLGKYGGKPRPGGLRATLCISSQVFLFFSIHLQLSFDHSWIYFCFVWHK